MPARTKRTHQEIIDLTADSSEIESEQPQRKTARLPLTMNRPSQSPHDAWAQDEDDDDEFDIIDLSQEVDNNGIGFVEVGRIDEKIVGIRYYNGYANIGETVIVRREPINPYDANAIRVNNVQGNQIGHLPRKLASKLAPYMDSQTLLVEGQLTGEKGPFDCPIRLKLFCTSDPSARLQVEAKMKADKLPIAKRPKESKSKALKELQDQKRVKMGFQGSYSTGNSQLEGDNGPSLEDLARDSERFRPRDFNELVEQWGATEYTLAKMPMADQPQNLQAQLLPYQRQGLAWMLAMESPILPAPGSKEIVQLWKCPASTGVYTNIATNYSTSSKPSLASGGILADDMGLGKTLQTISVILEGGPGTTLIIAPVSVMSNWSQQIERHVKSSKALRVLTYHGSNRKGMGPEDFASYNVVISTYGTLSTECFAGGSKTPGSIPSKRGLFSVKWRRVVLDEGHIIRNPSTKASVAASSLLAQSRWVLSGTPIVNTIKDLYSMLKFLRISGGLEKLELFNAILARPLAQGDPNAEVLLQSIMRTMCLRRKKEMKFVDLRLPELSEYVHRIQFRRDEREKYKALQAEAQGMLHKYKTKQSQANGKALDSYRHLLEILLRLRQVCCHWKLCGDRVTNLLSLLESEDVLELNQENRLALQTVLQLSIDSSDECAVCLETLHNPVITACKHVFGFECIERVISEQHKCPLCRAALRDVEQLVHPAVEQNGGEDEDIDINTKSSKTEALMSILRACRRDPKSKVVIFSQWTSFLNIIQSQLDESCFKYTRIDGSMPARARDTAIAALESDPDTRILLASLSVCSVGLNLVAADTVILADSWWAPAIEDQAVDRVHRLGQTRPTTVWRLVMEDSIEDRVLEIQMEKRKLVGKAFQEKSNKQEKVRMTRVADIQKLLR